MGTGSFEGMEAVYENRRVKLGILKNKYEKWTKLNLAIGWDASTPRLSRIYSRAMQKDRDKPWFMGEVTARHIEAMLGLPLCWMDTPATYADIHGLPDPSLEVQSVMEQIPQDKWPLAVNLLKTLASDSARDETNTPQAQSIKPAKFG